MASRPCLGLLALFLTSCASLAGALRKVEFVQDDSFEDAQVARSTGICPETQDELNVAAYIAKRRQWVADGSIARNIKEGTYTADSLSLEMYQWWVQRGLAAHGDAIDNFISMFTDAGQPQNPAPSKDVSRLVSLWARLTLSLGVAAVPQVAPLVVILSVGILSYETLAKAAADPEQHGSSDFLKAAQIWRTELPGRSTSHLTMVADFIHDLKSNDTEARLLPAYELVTELISNTPSFRTVFNQYYAAYLRSTVPHHEVFMAAMVEERLFRDPRVTLRALWTPAPAGLDACVIERSVMSVNRQCIDHTTPVLGDFFKVKALLIHPVWTAFEFSCDNIGPGLQTGCISMWGGHTNANETGNEGQPACHNWHSDTDARTTVFEQLRAACSSSIKIDSSTEVVAYNFLPDEFGRAEYGYYALSRFSSQSDFKKSTC